MNELEFFTRDELLALKTGTFAYDVESYENYFLVAFQCFATNKVFYFEAVDDEPFPTDFLAWVLNGDFCFVGFNSKQFDIYLVAMALKGYPPQALKEATRLMIEEGMRPTDVAKKYAFDLPFINHVDLIDVAPLQGSLKLYAARMHFKSLQELPYHPSATLNREQVANVRSYCFNDLGKTIALATELNKFLNLRAAMSSQYGRDMRSLSDAQVAQEIINTEIARIQGKRPTRPGFEKLVGTTFQYQPPAYVRFISPALQEMLDDVCRANIEIGPTGHVICPPEIEGRKVEIGGRIYAIGMGGLHSNEQRQALVSGDMRVLDRDVTGYYPNLILKNGFAPPHLGNTFLAALGEIVDRRTAAKKSGDTTTADSLKIASNGTFGKTSDPWSTIYAPSMTMQTTLTGQFSLLMAIEYLTLERFNVISANTDGIVTLCPQGKYDLFCAIFEYWEQVTKLATEETEYKALYSRDVNNYIAIKMDGKHKAKGTYSEFGSALNSRLSKNPESFIAVEAAIDRIKTGKPVRQTIQECKNIEKFVTVRNVAGGAQKNGRYLGKVIRWYYAKDMPGVINYCTNGNKVSLSEGGKPCMLLPDALPDDIDFDKYEALSTKILEDVGYQMRQNEQLSFLGD